jgi:transcriptional antiterminator RfaH
VSRLVTFGTEPAKVDDRLVDLLRAQAQMREARPLRLFTSGERLRLVDGAFAGVDAIYQMSEGDCRVMVLIEMLSKSVRLSVSPDSLRKLG